MKITGIRFQRVTGKWHFDEPLQAEWISRPVDIYPDRRALKTARAHSWVGTKTEPPYSVSDTYTWIDTDEGVSGFYGPTPAPAAWHIQHTLARVVIGEDPFATERIWDKMYRESIHGRKGDPMIAISHVDLALWDLKGKLLGVPVYKLLGGPSRDKIRAYASMLGYSTQPEKLAAKVKDVVKQGFTATKWFMQYIPIDGEEGVRRNVDVIRTAREAAGPDVEIMFDAWNSWDVPYTQRMAKLAAPYRPWWFEEPVLADMIPQYAELRRTISGVAIAGGEHEYTRWGAKALLDAEAVDILQADVTWAGGLTEMKKVCALASAHGIPVIPHHGDRASTHLIASEAITTCPMQEWLFQHGSRTQALLKHRIGPVNGYFELPQVPGLGIELNEDAVETSEEVSF